MIFFHQSTLAIVIKIILYVLPISNKQTNKQTNKQANKQTNKNNNKQKLNGD